MNTSGKAWIAAGLAWCGAVAAPAADTLVPAITTNDQRNLQMAVLADPTYVALAWDDRSAGHADVYARLYNRVSGLFGPAFRVNSYTNADQWNPAVARWSNGFVVAFSSEGYDGSDAAVAFRRFELIGAPVDAQDVQVNTITAGPQFHPRLMPLASGGFSVFFTGFSTNGQDVYYRRFGLGGTALDAGESAFNTLGVSAPVAGDQAAVEVAALTGGTFVAVFENRATQRIAATRFGAQGTPTNWPNLGPSVFAMDASPLAAGAFEAPAAVAVGGGFVVACSAETNGLPANRKVMARYFGPGGLSVTSFVLGAHTQRWERPRLTPALSGGFLAAWQAAGVGIDAASNHLAVFRGRSYGQDGSGYGTYLAAFGPLGLTIPDLDIARTGATIRISFVGDPYEIYGLDTSTNLIAWTPWITTNVPDSLVSVPYTPGAERVRHFRAWRLP
jgi:hypothetical protein